MFVVREADAIAIHAAFEQSGELSAMVELRRLFPRGVAPMIIAEQPGIRAWTCSWSTVGGSIGIGITVAKLSYETAGVWTLKLAEALGWPAGLAVTSFGADAPPVVVAGGKGGEVAWREWVASFGNEGDDDLTAVWGVLDRTKDLIAAGIDPGPPATWDAQASAAQDAEEAEEEQRPRPR